MVGRTLMPLNIKDNVLDVMTYTWMTGYDKNTGVELNMPRYVNFRMDKDGKISSMNIMDDQVRGTRPMML